MSWSVYGIGRAAKLREKAAAEFKTNACLELEETVRQAAAVLVDAALAAQDPDTVVRLAANGSQSFKDWSKKTGVSNNLNVVVEPMGNFVE